MVLSSACRAQLQPPISCLTAPTRRLYLPWLAPAQLRWAAQQRSLHRSHTGRRNGSNTSRHPANSQSRKASGLPGLESAPVDDGFASTIGPSIASSVQQQGWNFGATARARGEEDHSRYVMLKNEPQSVGKYKFEATTSDSADELLRHLETSLRVGKLDRAQSIIFRLTRGEHKTDAVTGAAYTLFLDFSLAALLRLVPQSHQAEAAFRDMQKWYQAEMQRTGVNITGVMLVQMIRGAIHALSSEESSLAIRMYVEEASAISEDVFEEALLSEEYTDTEYDLVNSVMADVGDSSGESSPAKQQIVDRVPQMTAARKHIDLTTLASVLATPTHGSGLKGVQEAMAALHEVPTPAPSVSSEERYEQNMLRQKVLEQAAVDIAVERWKDEDAQLKKIGINTAMQTKPMGALLWQWYTALLPELEAELDACRKLPHSLESVDDLTAERQHYGMYLELLPISKIAAVTILHTSDKLSGYQHTETPSGGLSIPATSLCLSLTKALQNEAITISARRSTKQTTSRRRKPKSKSLSSLSSSSSSSLSSLQTHSEGFSTWPRTVKLKLGAMLIKKLIETAKLPVTRRHPRTKERVTQLQPAFHTTARYDKGRKQTVLSANPSFAAKLESEPVHVLLAKRMPMVVEPKPWTTFADGAYHYFPSEIMRTNSAESGAKHHFIAAADRGDLGQLFAGLNALAKVPWRINQDVFKAQLEAWNTGEAIANFAPLNAVYKMPPAPDPSAGLDARRRWLLEVRNIENKKSGHKSERCFQNFQMEVARAMLNETMYFPHNLDFRGRAYPIPPYLNHMGADNSRSLLVFADGKELGKQGLRWLKIHLANVAGHDKASLQEREDFTMAHLEEIRDSARDPFGGQRWWLKSEDAWQTLAACYELVNALACPDPTKFISHLPVHQDGTCNGLQHYAALGGDKSGAQHVNLEPGERPADVYSGIAAGVSHAVERDAAAGHPIAKMLNGRITRKVVKQPVMTNVYGVTHYGARTQVRKQLEDLFPDLGYFDEINYNNTSGYIVEKIFAMLGSMFTGAQAIQRWLEVCADKITTCVASEQIEMLIAEFDRSHTPVTITSTGKRGRPTNASKSEKQSERSMLAKKPLRTRGPKPLTAPVFKSTVIWTTPLRLPVVQPYRSSRIRQVKTALQQLVLHEPRNSDAVDRRKQLQAFPPNFIHSLDATHMLMSAVKCAELGLSFASVHDSFWTHACDVTAMSTVLRDAFIDMHTEDVIGRLREEFQTRHHRSMYQKIVDRESAAFEKIKLWRKENEHPQQEIYELKLEYERMNLLASDDANQRIAGSQMVTPGSIFLAEESTKSKSSAGETTSTTLEDIDDDQSAIDLIDGSDHEPGTTPRKIPRTHAFRKPKVWLPVRFPPVPEKGDFDVTRLRQSKYFFH